MKKVVKKKRATPHVNGIRTSFVAIGSELGCDRETAAAYYKAITGKVTWVKLQGQISRAANAKARELQAIARRDSAIFSTRQHLRRQLSSIAEKYGLSVQRIQQIAGPLQ